MYTKEAKFSQYTSDILSQWEKGVFAAIYGNWDLFKWEEKNLYHQLLRLALLSKTICFVYQPACKTVLAVDSNHNLVFEISLEKWTKTFISGLLVSFEGIDVFIDENGNNIYTHIRYPRLLLRMRVEELEKMCGERQIPLPSKRTRKILRDLLLK